MDDEGYRGRPEHKATATRTSDPFDKMLSSMIGLPNGAHTKPAVVQAILPSKVLAVIDRQRESITKMLRRRHGQRIAEERKLSGKEPGFMKHKKGE
jgi:hypothetical protein